MSAINKIEKHSSRALLNRTSRRLRKRKKNGWLQRVVHTPSDRPRLVPGRWFTGLGGQQIHLHPDLMDIPVEESHERMYMHRLKELFLQPDEVWQDYDARHGNYWRYLKFRFDYMLVASVDIRDPQHVHVFHWYALEYDLPTYGRPPERQAGRQRQGIRIHIRNRSAR